MFRWWRKERSILEMSDGVHAFFANTFLRNLYMGMTVIFTPIFFYKEGLLRYGSVTNGLLTVVGFFVLERFIMIFLLFPIAKVIERIGFRRSVGVSLFFLTLYTASLILAKNNINWIWVAAIFLAIETPFYWIARDSVIAQDSSGREMGRNIASLGEWEKIAGIVGPFLGGLTLVAYGYQVMYGVAGILLLLSVVPLFWMHSHSHKNGVSVRGFFEWMKNRRYFHNAASNFATAVTDYSLSVIWPLILFFRGIETQMLGNIFSIVAVVSMILQYVSGKWFDQLRKMGKMEDEAVYGVMGVGTSIAWVARAFITTLRQILSVDIIGGLILTVFSGFYADYLHLGGKRMGSIAYWIYMEVIYCSGSILIFALMGAAVKYGVWMQMVALSAALWSLIAIVAARESNLK